MASFDSLHQRGGFEQYNGHFQPDSRPQTPGQPFLSSTPMSGSAGPGSAVFHQASHMGAGGNMYAPGERAQPQSGPNIFVPGSVGQTLNNPVVADIAMQYGQSMVGRGREELTRNLSRYGLHWQALRYYFAVDTAYVGRKLARILCPFIFADWSLAYVTDDNVAIQPKLDVNACDLYIPTMAYVTYVLMVGLALGLSHQFSPDKLAAAASASLVALLLEIGLVVAVVYFALVETAADPDLKKTTLSKWDVLSLSMYKYVSAIALLASALLFPTSRAVYVFSLLYLGAALAYFVLRTMKPRLQAGQQRQESYGYPPQMDPGLVASANTPGRKRKLYLVIAYTVCQPVLVWWLTLGLSSANWISNSGIEQGYYYNND